jgi:hypothetical protein
MKKKKAKDDRARALHRERTIRERQRARAISRASKLRQEKAAARSLSPSRRRASSGDAASGGGDAEKKTGGVHARNSAGLYAKNNVGGYALLDEEAGLAGPVPNGAISVEEPCVSVRVAPMGAGVGGGAGREGKGAVASPAVGGSEREHRAACLMQASGHQICAASPLFLTLALAVLPPPLRNAPPDTFERPLPTNSLSPVPSHDPSGPRSRHDTPFTLPFPPSARIRNMKPQLFP